MEKLHYARMIKRPSSHKAVGATINRAAVRVPFLHELGASTVTQALAGNWRPSCRGVCALPTTQILNLLAYKLQ